MSTVKRYIPRKNDREIDVRDSVMAVKLTKKNFKSTLKWASKFFPTGKIIGREEKLLPDGTAGSVKIRVRTPKGWRVVKEGEYLVRHYNYGLDQPLTQGDPIYFLSVGKEDFLEEWEQVQGGYFGD